MYIKSNQAGQQSEYFVSSFNCVFSVFVFESTQTFVSASNCDAQCVAVARNGHFVRVTLR